jgi:hypothetical protein
MTLAVFLRIARAVAGAGVIACVTAACEPPAPSPADAVQRAFDAYKNGDRAGVRRQLSPTGQASASFFCRGDAAACLSENYHQMGMNLTSTAKVVHQAELSARVVLTTTWAKQPAALCQEYSVERMKAGWGITYIEVPKRC